VSEVSASQAADVARSLIPPAIVIGDGLSAHAALFVRNGIALAEQSLWLGGAAVVARLGQRLYQSGLRHDALTLSPVYVRLPEPEEKRLKREGKL